MLATITQICRLFRNRRPTPGPKAAKLAARLSGIAGSSFAWCGCGQPLAPIIFGADKDPPEVIVLACPAGHGTVPVWNGLLCEALD